MAVKIKTRFQAPSLIKKNTISQNCSQHPPSLKTNIKYSRTAGVFFEDRSIFLVLTGQPKKGGIKEIIKWEHVKIPDLIEINTPRYPAFLKSVLGDFLGKDSKVKIWSGIDSKGLKLQNLNLPDIHDSKLANAAFWGLKKEIEVDAEKEIFDFEFIDNTQLSGIEKKNVVAFAGDKGQIFFLKKLFSDAGYPLTGITALPFCLQNFNRTNTIGTESSSVVITHIRRNYTEISCLSKKSVLLTRNIKIGLYSLANGLPSPEPETEESNDATPLLSPDITRNSVEFTHTVEPIAARLINKIIRTGEYASHKFAENEPISKFLFFGHADDFSAFMEYAAEQLPGKTEKFLPFEGHSTQRGTLPGRAENRAGVIPALGMALSDNRYTPNFLDTCLHKKIRAKYKKMNVTIAAVGTISLMICAGLWGWFHTLKNHEINERKRIEEQISGYNLLVSEQLLDRKISEARKKANLINRYAHDVLPLAVIHELCSLTPEKIAITSFDSDFATSDSQGHKDTKEKKEKRRRLVITGIVTADFTFLEPLLTEYILRLGASPLFESIQLKNKEIVKKEGVATMIFTADMEIFQ